MLLLCWLVPFILVAGVAGYYMSGSHFAGKISVEENQAKFNSRVCAERLNRMLERSREISYDREMEEEYHGYIKRQRKEGELSAAGNRYLSDHYGREEGALSAILWFRRNPYRMRSSTYNESAGGDYQKVKDYWQKDHEQIQVYADTLGTRAGFYAAGERLYLVRNLLDTSYRSVGVLVLRLNKDYCFGNFLNTPYDTSVTIRIDDCTIVLAGEELFGERIAKSYDAYTSGYVWERNKLCIFHKINASDYRLETLVRYEDAAAVVSFYGYRFVIAGMLVLLVPLLCAAVWIFRKQVADPVETMMRDAKIMALQSHINPHFMNNTLEIINWEARLSGSPKVSKMIEALSTLMDAGIDRKKLPEVPLSEEMIYVNAYLYIISERLGKRLTVQIDLPEEIMTCRVPRLVLQPVIENAVEHGAVKNGTGTVEIRGRKEGAYLYLEIMNDGSITVEDEAKIQRLLAPGYDTSREPSGNMGIANVNQRLQIIYGEPCGLTVFRTDENHVMTRLVIRADKPDKIRQQMP